MKSLKKIKSLILGANGYMGRHLVQELRNHGHAVIPSDIQSKSIDNVPRYISVDIGNPKRLLPIIKRMDQIFIFAGMTGTTDAFEKYTSYITINEIGLLNILSAHVKTKSSARIIFPSSRLIYRGKRNKHLKESDDNDFLSIYAINKFSNEKYLELYNKVYGTPYTIFRICVPYGNSLDTSLSYGTINHFVSQAKQGKDITLYGNGQQKRTLTHIDDITSIIRRAAYLRKTNNATFNIGGPDHLSIRSVASTIAKIFGVRVTSIPWPPLAKKLESGDTIFNSKKLDTLLHYSYQHTFSQWAKEYFKKR